MESGPDKNLNTIIKSAGIFVSSVMFFLILFETKSGFAFEKGPFLRYCLNKNKTNLELSHRFLLNSSPSDLDGLKSQVPGLILSLSEIEKVETEGGTLSAEEQTSFLVHILEDYMNLYLENQDIFDPYRHLLLVSENDKSLMLYRSLCQEESFKPICKGFKTQLIHFFSEKLHNEDPRSLKNSIPNNRQIFLASLNQDVKYIRQKFLEVQEEIRSEMKLKFIESGWIKKEKTYSQYNELILKIIEDPKLINKIKQYENLFFELASSPGREILLTHEMLQRIEGNYFHITYSDLILAVSEISEELRKDFRKLVSENPQIIRYLEKMALNHAPFGLKPLMGQLPKVHGYPMDLSCEKFLSAWLKSSDLFPSLVNSKSFEILGKFYFEDLTYIELMARGQYQRAVWRLRTIGQSVPAQRLESWIDRDVLRDDDVEKSSPLGGGFTTTTILTFPYGVRGVYKPAPASFFSLQGFRDSVAGNFKSEVAAYRMDRLLDLNLVPLTKEVTLAKGRGSLQYFVNKTTSGRLMVEVDMNHPIRAGKWSLPSGRAAHPKDVKMFDWLISNWDRNLDNYLLSNDGRFILIDHGCSFEASIFFRPSHQKMEEIIPSLNLYQKIAQINKTPELIDEEISNLVPSSKIAVIKSKIKSVVEYIEDRVSKEGVEQVFHEL